VKGAAKQQEEQQFKQQDNVLAIPFVEGLDAITSKNIAKPDDYYDNMRLEYRYNNSRSPTAREFLAQLRPKTSNTKPIIYIIKLYRCVWRVTPSLTWRKEFTAHS